MKLQVFAVYDNATAIYSHAHHLVSIPAALRAFEAALEDPKSEIRRFAKDYSLFHLGSYDDSTGVFTNLPAPVRLASAHELIVKPYDFDDAVTGARATMPFPTNGVHK